MEIVVINSVGVSSIDMVIERKRVDLLLDEEILALGKKKSHKGSDIVLSQIIQETKPEFKLVCCPLL